MNKTTIQEAHLDFTKLKKQYAKNKWKKLKKVYFNREFDVTINCFANVRFEKARDALRRNVQKENQFLRFYAPRTAKNVKFIQNNSSCNGLRNGISRRQSFKLFGLFSKRKPRK